MIVTIGGLVKGRQACGIAAVRASAKQPKIVKIGGLVEGRQACGIAAVRAYAKQPKIVKIGKGIISLRPKGFMVKLG